MGFFSKLPLTSTSLIILQVVAIAHGQIPLQVEFEKGSPLARDPLPASELNKPSNGVLNDDSLEWRVPLDFKPEEYDVQISPILQNDSPDVGAQWEVPGNVAIRFKPVTNATTIVLHSKDTNITSYLLQDHLTGENISVTLEVGPHETIRLDLGLNKLEINKDYVLKFEFVSQIKEGLDGLYRSSYFDPISNTTKWIASTQMEALHARQLFPCFDEPSFKAIFHFVIGRKTEHVALFNTKSQRIRPMTGALNWVLETFAPTPVMSTYLLAIIISEFEYVDAQDLPGGGVFGKQVRTYAPKHYIDRGGGEYATEKADRLLKFFQDYYVETYPVDKMDSAAVPAFFFGAMENYGLNIYRETALLYFPDESTEDERWRITSILSHELAHQWFGNLVTTAWWTHIWLNEGFATYLAAQGAAAAGVGQEFESLERFINDAGQNSMGFDARPDYSHSVKIDEEDWITRGAMDWFDRMAYEKAGSLIRMMNGFLTEPVLKAGLLDYLKAMQYKAATQDDLFQYLNGQAKASAMIPDELTMKQIMDTWTLQPGFPLVRVSVASPQSVYVSQERFINNEASMQLKQSMTGLWFVPLTVSSGADNATSTIEWLYDDVAMRTLRIDTSQWLIVNNGANGYFRTLYDAPLTKSLKEQLEKDHTVVNAVTRSQLLDDYFTAAWQKYTNIENALGLASYLGNETDIVVWNSVLNNLRTPFNLLSNSGSFYTSLRAFLYPRIKSAMEKTGGIEQTLPEMKGGMHVLRHLQFLDWLCGFEDQDCVDYALTLVNGWKAQPEVNSIRRDIKPVVYCAAVAHGTDEHFNFIKEQYEVQGITDKQRGSLLNALTCTKEPSRIRELLEKIVDDTYYVSDANRRTILQVLPRNPIARQILIQFLRAGNVQPISDKLNGTASIVASLTTFSTFASTQSEMDDFEMLLSEVPSLEQDSPTAIAAARKMIKTNIDWVAEYGSNLRAYATTAN